MKKTHTLSLLPGLAALALLAPRPAPAQSIVTFDFPGATSTRGISINDSGDVVGLFVDSSGAFKGYERFANGTFSAAIVAPGDNQNYTRALGINNAGTIVGGYLNVTGNLTEYHGYILRGTTFTIYDEGGPYSTDVYAINTAGDITGDYDSDIDVGGGFLTVDGVQTTFAGPSGFMGLLSQGINSSDVVVGQYADSDNNTHGFSRNPITGAITTIDAPGATLTTASGINGAGVIVGNYQGSDGINHGYIDRKGVFTTFDVPGAQNTAVRGINSVGGLVGQYVDSANIQHGFLATLPAPTTSTPHLLWDNTNGTASLWTIKSDGTFTSVAYGPYAGWTARAVSDGPDGVTHLLWTKTDGTAAVWNVTASGSFTSHQYGPYANVAAVSLSTGADGYSHLLWNRTDGLAFLWAVNTTTGTFTNQQFGPYAGWTAKAVASGGTTTDLLWTNTNGQMAGYRFASNGNLTMPTFGPYANYAAKALSVGPDDIAHPLWDNANGTAALWNAGFTNGSFTAKQYGPYAGWTAKAVATGPDNVSHLLWNHAPDNQASLFSIPASGGFTSKQYGPYAGWQAVAVSAGP